VLTRNLYLGAALDPVIAATTPAAFIAATTEVWTIVQRNDFRIRAEAIADEIEEAEPDLVGLQEAYLWRIQSPGDFLTGGTTPATTVVYDDVQLILDALAARGLSYRAAVVLPLFDFEAPIATGDDVRLTDRLVILARAQVETSDPVAQVYQTLLPLRVLGRDLTVPRGYAWVDAKVRGQRLRFATTHLESFNAQVRVAQATELAAALSGFAGPVTLVGDLNSVPGQEGEAVLVAAGFQDAWATLHPGQPGLTCCFAADLHETAQALTDRIDYVLTRGPLAPEAIEILGARPAERVQGLWPSDHAGLAAEVEGVRGGHHR
jgi:endonuclease/exonuclease/phosphatase family metal-dependent hydrolase